MGERTAEREGGELGNVVVRKIDCLQICVGIKVFQKFCYHSLVLKVHLKFGHVECDQQPKLWHGEKLCHFVCELGLVHFDMLPQQRVTCDFSDVCRNL